MSGEDQAFRPFDMLREISRTVPVVKYATGLVGIAMAVSLARGFLNGMSPIQMLPVLLGSMACMAVLIVLASAVQAGRRGGFSPGHALLWAASLFMILGMAFTITAVAFGWPPKWAALILPAQAAEQPIVDVGVTPEPRVVEEEAEPAAPPVALPQPEPRATTSPAPAPAPAPSVPAAAPSTPTPIEPADFNHEVTIRNRSGQVLHFLYASMPSEGWGDDLIPDRVIGDGESIRRSYGVGRDQCIFDFKVTLEDDTELEQREVNVCRVSVLTVLPDGIAAD